MDLPLHLHAASRSAGSRAHRTALRGPGHVRGGAAERQVARPHGQHVPHLDLSGKGSVAVRRERVGGAFQFAGEGRHEAVEAIRASATRRQRCGGRSGEPLRAEGCLPLRLGLGAAAGHQRHLAARGTGGLGPCPHRGRAAPAGVPGRYRAGHHQGPGGRGCFQGPAQRGGGRGAFNGSPEARLRHARAGEHAGGRGPLGAQRVR